MAKSMHDTYANRAEWLDAQSAEREFVDMVNALRMMAEDLGEEPTPILARFAEKGLKTVLGDIAERKGTPVDALYLRCRARASRSRTSEAGAS